MKETLSREEKIEKLQELMARGRQIAIVLRYAYPDQSLTLWKGKPIDEKYLQAINARYDTTLIILNYRNGTTETDPAD